MGTSARWLLVTAVACWGAEIGATGISMAFDSLPYFPLHVGDHWVYSRNGQTVRVRVQRMTSFAGRTCFEVVRSEGGQTTRQYWTQESGASFYFGYKDAAGNITRYDPPIEIPPSLSVGQTVSVSGRLFINGLEIGLFSWKMKVNSADETISVTAGNFSHVLSADIEFTSRISDRVDTDKLALFAAPGVGTIKADNDPDHPGTDVEELTYAYVDGREYPQQPPPAVPGDVNGNGRLDHEEAQITVEALLAEIAGQSGYYNSKIDLYPYTGDLPRITPVPDGHIDFEDIKVFVRLWEILASIGP